MMSADGCFVVVVDSTDDVVWVVACTSVCFSLVVFDVSAGSVVAFAVVESVPVSDVVGDDKPVDVCVEVSMEGVDWAVVTRLAVDDLRSVCFSLVTSDVVVFLSVIVDMVDDIVLLACSEELVRTNSVVVDDVNFSVEEGNTVV